MTVPLWAPWHCWHRIEFTRIDERGRRHREHVEEHDDHSPYVAGPASYAYVAGEEYLSREGRPAGERWIVTVWRLDEPGGPPVRRLAQVELRTTVDEVDGMSVTVVGGHR